MMNVKKGKIAYAAYGLRLSLMFASVGSAKKIDWQLLRSPKVSKVMDGAIAQIPIEDQVASTHTSASNDERDLWKYFRWELFQLGFSPSIIKDQKPVLKASIDGYNEIVKILTNNLLEKTNAAGKLRAQLQNEQPRIDTNLYLHAGGLCESHQISVYRTDWPVLFEVV